MGVGKLGTAVLTYVNLKEIWPPALFHLTILGQYNGDGGGREA